jgi:antitoxin (DNA-binding transcriptional repressor) of toxin-antitoxin stability system
MKTMTIRDVRQRWPEAERALEVEREILITRDGKPVARLLPVEEVPSERKRFDPEESRKRREQIWESAEPFDSTPFLMDAREERKLV